jgi:predicted ABC-type exoprotein transport system permease subunit
MPTLPKSKQVRRITRSAFFLSLAANVVPILYSIYTIATPSYYRAPGYAEVRIIIVILGLAGVSLGGLALYWRTHSKTLAIIAVILGLIAPIVHVFLCGSDALHQKNILFCPMLWGIRIG